jgi:ATP-dependent DNA helicase RecG
MSNLDQPITSLPGVGPAAAKNFVRLGIHNIHDLLWHLPLRFLDFRNTIPVSEVKQGQSVTLQGTIKSITSSFAFRGRLSRAEAVLSDKSGSIKIIWFNQPYIAKALAPGDEVAVAGSATYYKNVLQLHNPIYEKLGKDNVHTGRLVPVYGGSTVVSNRAMRNAMAAALSAADQEEETLPESILKKFELPQIGTTLKTLHFPEEEADLDQARNRIAFEELLVHQLAVRLREKQKETDQAPILPIQTDQISAALEDLPFTLTAGQKRALWDIMQDMASGTPMVRLLQGDVGSGKTLVAALAGLETAIAGWQTAFVAPTEILAVQHYKYLQKYLPYVSVGLLTRNFAEANSNKFTKKELLALISSNKVQILVGTHAVLQKEVDFNKLGLAVIDEQHRFGVEQRSFMLNRENFANLTPHLLSMSATPIPRTLALSFYGSLKISTLNTLPQGKKQIITKVVTDSNRDSVYEDIRSHVAEGAQAFIVTPRVEETEASSLKSVKAEFERLQKEVFSKIPMGLLYGGMKGSDKEKAMSEFAEGNTKILVSTSVIEIGIDVPQANYIVIEGAERFGLAQLHQLRGRVGRAGQKSYCVLFTDSEDEKTLERLKFFAGCLDGFQLAEKDLQQRGFGNLFGTEQSGFAFEFSRFFTSKTAADAQAGALALIKKSPTLKAYPNLLKKVRPLLENSHAE